VSKWWLEEPYVSRVLDEIYIEASDGKVSFSLVKKRNNEAEEIARVDEIDKVLGDDMMHCLCDEFLCYCHDGEWDREWSSVQSGLYIVDVDEGCLTLDQSIFDNHFMRDLLPDDTGAVPWSTLLTGFPRFWELFGFLLSRRTRERIFEPAYHDLLSRYMLSRQKRFRTPWARRWLNFCFTFRTLLLVLQCCKVTFCGGALAVLLFLVPPAVKEWCREFWFNLFR